MRSRGLGSRTAGQPAHGLEIRAHESQVELVSTLPVLSLLPSAIQSQMECRSTGLGFPQGRVADRSQSNGCEDPSKGLITTDHGRTEGTRHRVRGDRAAGNGGTEGTWEAPEGVN